MGKMWCFVCGASGYKFHRFPADADRLKIWCEALRVDTTAIRKYSYICLNHFKPSDIINIGDKAFISSIAVPVISPSSHILSPTAPRRTETQRSMLSEFMKSERTSNLWQFDESSDNTNLWDDMDIKTEPCKIEVNDDEETLSIPELRLKCCTCMESVTNTAVSVMAIHSMSKSIKDAVIQLIPQLMLSLQDQDVICSKCLKILETTLLFIQRALRVNKVLVEEEIDLRDKNKSNNGDSPGPLRSNGSIPTTNEDRIISPTVSNDPGKANTCCSDEECLNNRGQNVDADSNDYIKIVDSELEDWVDVSDDDIELFSDSSTDVAGSVKQIEPANESNLVKGLRRINFSFFDNNDVEDNNSVVTINSVKQSTASKFIFGLEKIGVKVLSSLDKPDLNNCFHKKRILLIGNVNVKYCPLCSEEVFLTEDKLFQHFNEAHNLSKAFLLSPKLCYEKGKCIPRKVFCCPYCDEIVGEKQLAIHTEKQHDDNKPFKCYKCKKEYRRYLQLSNHYCFSKIAPIKKKLNIREKRKCGVCKEKISLELYRVHFDNHKIFKCLRCGKKFTNSTTLTNHETLHHTKTELCPICGKIFYGVGLQLHMANHAEKEQCDKDFLCEFCPKSFSSNKSLRAHTKVVHLQNKVLCELCGEKLRASTLSAHIRLKHSKEAIYTCTICGEGFSRSDYFNRHVASHSEKKAYRKLGAISGKNTPTKCRICSKQLTSTNYYQHLNSHVTLKRFKCRFCNMSYNNYSNARRHEREHLKNPSYHFRCNICWKTFENNKDLNEHTDTHEKKYKCDECGKSFGRKFALSSHIAEAHTDEAEVDKKEESLRQCYGIGIKKRNRLRKKTIFDELGDLFKDAKIEIIQENEN